MSDAPLIPRVEAEPCATEELPSAPLPPPAPPDQVEIDDDNKRPRIPQDWLDLQIRLKKAEESLKSLSLAYDELQSQAYALVWLVKDEHTVGEIKELRDRFQKSFERAHQLEAENAALRQDALQTVKGAADEIMAKVNPERRKVFKKGSYTGPGEVVITFANKKGERRFVVAHTIEGGEGEMYHIYSEREIG